MVKRELSQLDKEIQDLRLFPNKKKENAVKRRVRRTMLTNTAAFMSSDEAAEAFIIAMNATVREKPDVYAKLYLDYEKNIRQEKDLKINGNTFNNYNFAEMTTEQLRKIADGEDLAEELDEVIDVTQDE